MSSRSVVGRMSALGIASLAIGLAVSLVGCSSAAQPTVVVTPGPVVTKTIVTTPTPAPLADGSALTQIQAWDTCVGAQSIGSSEAYRKAHPGNSYDPSFVVPIAAGGYTVVLHGTVAKPTQYCTVKGTVGHPLVSAFPPLDQ